ncbi:hypothetical protein [Polaribacter sp. Z022]|uniref:hypothetical protein n=1 Tax=Polaribacter sp. Z022 TaxID=2927125 RepID=UPI002020D17D|nr:hypothetical protein [Polaribacter sp. Z022]MCL7754994.1 hypothetical protein [Polaribacter sp. Z022]
MHQKLILEAFEKARKDEEMETGISVSNHKVSERISDILFNDYKCTFGDKSLRILFNEARDNNEKKVIIKQQIVINSLCKYLGYDNYIDFVENNVDLKKNNVLPQEKQKNKKLGWLNGILNVVKNNKIAIILGITLITLVIVFSFNKQRWMVWENNKYVEVKFDTEKYKVGQLKIYKEERIKFFKKIEPNCDVKYFEENGQARFWYGKNPNGKFEIFTSLGLHPQTGKTLKPISKYMIDKYFCVK